MEITIISITNLFFLYVNSLSFEAFKSLTGDSDADSLTAFIHQISSGVEDSLSPIVLSPSSDQSHRTAVHTFFKERLKFLVTDTIDGLDTSSKCIRVWFDAGGNNGTGRNSGGNNGTSRNSKKWKDRGSKRYDNRGSDNWPGHLDKFLRNDFFKLDTKGTWLSPLLLLFGFLFFFGYTRRIVFQNLLLESNAEILQCSERVWRLLLQVLNSLDAQWKTWKLLQSCIFLIG